MTTALVVGSGPNGLAAAIHLAGAGLDVTLVEGRDTVGGGMRSAELTVPGLVHDVCSAVHVLGVASPYLRTLPLADHGLRWLHGRIGVAHPLDDGTAAIQAPTFERTATAFGEDEAAWRRRFRVFERAGDRLLDELMQPALHLPRRPVAFASFGLRALMPATMFARGLRTDAARALFAGAAAHVIAPLTGPLTTAAGYVLLGVGQRHGWPVAEGGSQAIADAMASLLRAEGGRIETGRWIGSAAELDADVVVLDTAPDAAARILGDQLPERSRRAYQRWRFGPGAFKVDLAVEGGIPWTAPECRQAVTVHLGGRMEQIVEAEQQVADGRVADAPYVLVAQQYLADPGRSVGGVHPVWTYCHVPNGYDGDATEAVLAQLERFAPGTRERIVGMHTMGPAEFAAYDPNYVGGDIATGANDPVQTVLRPRVTTRPYATGAPRVFICSAATPPGAGVHGMSGVNAARAALAAL